MQARWNAPLQIEPPQGRLFTRIGNFRKFCRDIHTRTRNFCEFCTPVPQNTRVRAQHFHTCPELLEVLHARATLPVPSVRLSYPYLELL